MNKRLARAIAQAQHAPSILVNGAWPWHDLIANAKTRAKAKGLPFELDDDWARARYTGRCELSGLAFVTKGKRTPYSMSIDRINPALGYTRANSRFILWGYNALKSDGANDDDLMALCLALALR